jgi:hypothetical protein
MKNIFYFLVVFISFVSCTSKAEEATGELISVNDYASSTDSQNAPPPPPLAKVDQVKFVKPIVANSEEVAVAKIEQKIIKTGTVKFETNDLENTYNQMLLAVKKHSAVIQNDTEGKEYNSIYRRIIIRVPNQNFDTFLNDISKGVSFFDNKEISSQDITAEYIDVDARLKAKKVLESRYLELLKKANKVSEMLEIEAQLSAIREEIEAKQGQLRYMQSQITMSTLNIEFYKTVAIEDGATVSYGSKFLNAISSGFNSILNFCIDLVSIWPFLIILAAIVYIIRKRFQKKRT